MPIQTDRRRERLKGLMLVRVLLVTAFLGSAVAVDAATFADVSQPRNLTIVALIVLTYVMTIGYALGLAREMTTRRLAHVQLVGDLFITTVLTLVTGGFDSLFLFFYHLTIINAAMVAGHRTALVVATATAGCMGYFAALSIGWLPHPILETDLPPINFTNILYEVTVNSLAGFLIAALAGRLAHRLDRAAAQIRRQETDIADLQALNKNILSSISSGLLTIDDEGVVIFFNRAAQQITGLDADEVLGRPLERVFPDLAAKAADQDPDDPDPRLELTYERPDGTELYLGFSVSPLRNPAGEKTGRIIIFQDLSEIRELQQRAKRSERLAAIGELSAAIAHEIRNPLASISGSVEMLDTEDDLSEENRMLMNVILREVERLDDLIGDFLEYCQPRELDTTPQDPTPVVEDVVQLFEGRQDAPDVEIDGVDGDRQPQVELDAESFRQVLWNLLQNSTDALESLGDDRNRIRIELTLADDDSDLLIAVEDDGPGFDEETGDRLFEPFFSTREEGSGLGLATTHRIIQEHGGDIEAGDAKTLAGARFEVRLPVVDVEDTKKTEPTDATEETVPQA